MALALEDRLAVTELIALHGHLVGAGDLDRAVEVFRGVRVDAGWRISHCRVPRRVPLNGLGQE